MWLTEEKGHRDSKANKREEVSSRFVTLSRDLQMLVFPDFDSGSHDDELNDDLEEGE